VFAREERNFFRRNTVRIYLIVPRFRNVPILAEKAAHVAAGSSHAENLRSREKMIERLLFNRIDLERRGRTVAETKKFSAAIYAYKTETGLAFVDVAVARAKITVDAVAGFWFPPSALVESLFGLQDLQACHVSLPARIINPLSGQRR